MIAAPTLFFDLPMAYPMTAMTPIQRMIAPLFQFRMVVSDFSVRLAPELFFGLRTLGLIGPLAVAI